MTAKKPRDKPRAARLETPSHGQGKLKRGGVNPGGGRPKQEYKEWCQSLLDSADSRAQAEAVLKDSQHPAYHQMYKELANRAFGKPKETIDVNITDLSTMTDEELAKRRKAIGLA